MPSGHHSYQHQSWGTAHMEGALWRTLQAEKQTCRCRKDSPPCASTLLTSDCFTSRSISRRQVASTALNLRPSFGICCWMSSLPKIGSRYSQPC